MSARWCLAAMGIVAGTTACNLDLPDQVDSASTSTSSATTTSSAATSDGGGGSTTTTASTGGGGTMATTSSGPTEGAPCENHGDPIAPCPLNEHCCYDPTQRSSDQCIATNCDSNNLLLWCSSSPSTCAATQVCCFDMVFSEALCESSCQSDEHKLCETADDCTTGDSCEELPDLDLDYRPFYKVCTPPA